MVRDTSLLVIGAGPTGIAALLAAAAEGIDAVAIERGPAPLMSIHGWMHGLRALSPPKHFALPGLPLDHRDPTELNREEILSYYARTISHVGLRVLLEHRFVGLRFSRDRVLVDVATAEGPQRIRARDVLVTSWFRPRRIKRVRCRVPVLEGLREPTLLMGKKVVIVGGGYSAFDAATALMELGIETIVVARSGLAWPFFTPVFEALRRTSASRVITGAGSITAEDGGVSYDDALGVRRHVGADAVVVAAGQELLPDVCKILRDASILSEGELAQLRSAPSPDHLLRTGAAATGVEAIAIAVSRWPDLKSRLFDGVRGVRLAGAILHPGGPHAGVATSILSAACAVHRIRQKPLTVPREPLPAALWGAWGVRAAKVTMPPRSFNAAARIKPLPIQSWSRRAGVRAVEDCAGVARPSSKSGNVERFLLKPLRPRQTARDILSAADGQTTLAELLDQASNRAWLMEWLNELWSANGLTWLPSVRRRRKL